MENINNKIKASQDSENLQVRRSGRVRKVSKKLLESFETGELMKMNKVDEKMEVAQVEENKENVQKEQNVDAMRRVRQDLKVLRRLQKSVEQLRKHINRIGEHGALQQCQIILTSIGMLSVSDKT